MAQPNPFDVFDTAPAGGPLASPPPKAPAPVDPLVAEGRALENEIKRRKLAEGGEDNGGAAIPTSFYSKIDPQVGTYTAYQSALSGFQDDFAGNTIAGGLENSAQRLIGTGTPRQAEWWSNFQRVDNKVRNELFGATLTPSEQSAYLATTITPRMLPSEVRAVLESRAQILRSALERQRQFALSNGYKPQAVDALFAPIIEQQEALAETADTATETEEAAGAPPAPSGGGEGLTPPAFGAPAIPNKGFLTNAGGQIAGNTHTGGDDNAEGIARGQSRREDNPVLAGVRDEYTRRLARGDDAEALIAWAKGAGVDPSAFPSITAQAAFRRDHPEIAIGEYDTSQLDDRFVKIDPLSRGITGMSDTGPGPFAVSAGDAFTGFNLDSIIGATGGNAEQARLGMDEIAEQHPVASTAGTVAGGVAAALGAEGTLAARGMAAGLPRMMIADSAYGAAAGAGATDYGPDGAPATVADRFLGAGKGALAGAAGSYTGYRAGNALGKVGRGVSDPSVNTLRQEGVDALTVGQTFGQSGRIGKAIKGVEDRLAGLPVVGDMINARRAEGLRQFNARAFDKALEPIGGTVGDAVGEEAVDRAQTAVSQAFREALDGKGAVPDQAFADELAEAVGKVRSVKRIGEEVTDQIGEILQPYADEALLSGEALDDISRNLRALRTAYSADPLAIPVARRVDQVERAIFDLFDRQAAGTIPAYKTARQAYRRLSVIEDAVLKGKNTEGQFTPAQLGMADRTNAVRYGGKRSAASGGGVFHDFQRAAQNVLPNKVPDSGTAGRVLVPLALVGGGAGADAAAGGSSTGLTIGAILAGLYSRTGQRLLTKPGRGMKAGTRRKAALESPVTRRAISGAAAGSGIALTTQ
jgi:hypothetical protein